MATLLEIEEEKFSKLANQFQVLYDVWNQVGIEDEQKVSRANQVWAHVFGLFKEIIKEEQELFQLIKEEIKKLEKDIIEISAKLDIPVGEVITGTPIVKKKILVQRLDILKELTNKRQKEFDLLRKSELGYCETLGMPPLNLSSTAGVLSEKVIYELQQHVDMLKEEIERRQKKFFMLRKELTTILETTELTPETPLENNILSNKEISLSNETLKEFETIVNKKKSAKAVLENKKAVLMDKLCVLWDLLKVEKEDRERFLSKHTDCRVSNIEAINKEIARCEEIKKQNIATYIDALKEELLSLFEKCFIAQSENKLSFFAENEMDETVLETYDKEVEKWRKYYKDTEHIIQKINKRRQLWDLAIAFENKINDPNRFKNRGGNLLQEERQRKKLQKDLPNLEKEIFHDIDKYEEETGKRFLYFGGDFRDFASKEWDDRMAQKENEKLVRQKLRSTQIDNVHATGTLLVKRPYPAATPKSAPSKLLKSNVGVPLFRTPNFSTFRPAANTASKIKTRQLRSSAKKLEKKLLKEKNENGSDCLDTTTYTAFAEKLERSSRCTHRSSVLSCRKVGGTRISLNKSRPKSVNKSSKSLQKRVRKEIPEE